MLAATKDSRATATGARTAVRLPARPEAAGAINPLPPPRALRQRLAPSSKTAAHVEQARKAIRSVLRGRDGRLIAIAGPCSIHAAEEALEYARRLAAVAEATRGELIVVMRTYFEKPRSTVGWKGLINDPALDGSCDLGRGIALAREILLAINALGLPCATEILEPPVAAYLEDLLAWVAIGARTSESQPHRALASGLPMPVGIKNNTAGSLQAAADGILAAAQPHHFLGNDLDGQLVAIATTGNPDGHIVLRGGDRGPNYDPGSVAQAARIAAFGGLERPVLVDCSHQNSGGDHRCQATVCRAVLEQFRAGQTALAGLMLESQLQPGKQRWKLGSRPRAGVSITDACIGWNETEDLLYATAEVVTHAAA